MTCKRRGLADRIEALEADALAIPKGDAIADRAITLAAWHHLDDPQAACNELARVLKPGGKLVVVDLEISPRHQPGQHLPGHDRTFTERDMRRILEAAHLEVFTIETVGRWIIGAAEKKPAD